MWTVFTLVLMLILRRVARRIVGRNVDDSEGIYRANKVEFNPGRGSLAAMAR